MKTIKVYRHYFTITDTNFYKLIYQLQDFNKKLVTYTMARSGKYGKARSKVVSKVDRILYTIEYENSENNNSENKIRYPISLLDKMLDYLKKHNIEDDLKIINIEPDDYINIDININKDLTPRDYQEAYIDTITSWDKNNMLIDLETGRGKTFIAMSSIAIMKQRFAIVILPRYIDKWIGDVKYLTDLQDKDIFVVQGLELLIDVVINSDKYKQYKCFIFSLTTINMFIKSYLNSDVVASLGLTPEMIFKNLKIGITLNDESHQEFYNVYRLMLFCNHRLSLGLSATLVHTDKSISNMYKLGYPEDRRITAITQANRYLHVLAIRFRFKNKKYIRYKSLFGYSTAVYEKSIMSNPLVLNNYLDMIKSIAETIYIKRSELGEKLMIFMGTVKMCKLTAKYFKRNYKNYKVTTYTEKDDYSVIDKSDIIVSTPQSAGTALDIKNLISVINTVNTGSVQQNKQMSGRLREIPNRRVIYAYIYTSDIPQHKRYTFEKQKLYNRTALTNRAMEYRKLI